MVARHGELSMFFLDNEVVERFLLRELIAQAHTIVIDTETNGDVALGRSLVQVDLHLIVVVADGGSLSPYRFPSLIKGGSLAAGLGETVHQVSLLHAFAGMLVLCQLQTEMGWLDDCLSLVGHLVSRLSLVTQGECQADITIRRLHCLGSCQHREQQTHQQNAEFLHISSYY